MLLPSRMGSSLLGSSKGANAPDEELCAYITHPILDVRAVADISSAVRAEMKGWLLKARTECTRVFAAPNGQSLDKWMESWPEPKPNADVDADGKPTVGFEETFTPPPEWAGARI